MNKQTNNKESGFTIIEVVLVLAIAGLIFLIVFLALPQLQKSRRDTQRRNDTARIAAALESYAGNSNGNYPSTSTELDNFVDTFITDQNFVDPTDAEEYVLNNGSGAINGGATGAIDPGTWSYYEEARCGDNGITEDADGVRNVAVRMGLEQGIYCVDNQ